MNLVRVVSLAIVLLAVAVGQAGADTRIAAMWKLLARAEFYPPRDSNMRLWDLGEIATKRRHYDIWRLRWREPREHMAGSYRHEGNWVLVVERTPQGPRLLGHYGIHYNTARVVGRAIEIDSNFGSASKPERIIFSDAGPPRRVDVEKGHYMFELAEQYGGIWGVLTRDHFTGKTDIYAKVRRAGVIASGARKFEIWSYSWEEGREAWGDDPRGHRHQDYRVLVFERKKSAFSYWGGYERDNVPFRVEGHTVKFDLPQGGKPPGRRDADRGEGIVFIDDNGPPMQAHVNWVTRTFKK